MADFRRDTPFPNRLTMQDRFSNKDPLSVGSMEVRVAVTENEFEEAFRVGYSIYQPMGYVKENKFGMRGTKRQLQKNSLVLYAVLNDRVVGTMSLYEDDEEGIPSDAGWKLYIDPLRKKRKKIVECGSLMVQSGRRSFDRYICLNLFRQAWLYSRDILRADTMCAFARSRHVGFYRKLMGFKKFGPGHEYIWNGLNLPVCIPVWMDLNMAEEDFRNRFDHFGESERNLYQMFVVHGRRKALPVLLHDLERRGRSNFPELQEKFKALTSITKNPIDSDRMAVTE